ncbi:pirin family protein [Cetobacterium somerae]|uniref:pirin family protein n=1 Tax=Cetobacterium sp. NK01 TaxID=2993530 RepID=UPI002115D066|nr:pirin-like bicupin family protein [Cetobacterium sp. NK01]MCQ8211163.1 pirin family protein [Cetobacterium sp. NK01]
MLIKKLKSHMGESKFDWLYSLHHFSFGEYYDSHNLGVGPLRVINDDIIAPHTGFETHSHKDMEILTYILEGAITHKDNIHNEEKKVEKGSVQYMSAGKGVSHSEFNKENIETRLVQIWIIPDKNGYEPKYGQVDFKWEDRVNKLLLIASGEKEAPIKINQSVNIYALYLEKNRKIKFSPNKGYGYYIAFFQGKTKISDLIADKYEAIMGDENIEINSLEDTHMLIFEIKKK